MPCDMAATTRTALIALCLLCFGLPSTGQQTKVYGQIPAEVGPGMGPNPAADAPRYSVVITDENRIGMVHKAQAANPSIEFFLYEVVGGTYENIPAKNDPIGYNWLIQHHPEWFLKDGTGQRMHFSSFPDVVALDVGDPGYQREWTQDAIAIAKALGAKGISIDNVNSRYDWNFRVIPAKYPDRASYAKAMDSFVRYIVGPIHAAGLLVIGNGSGETSANGMWAQWNRLLDGRQYEQVPICEDGTPQDVDARWLDLFNGFKTFSDKISVFYLPTKSVSEQNFRYAIASLLIWAGSRSYMGIAAGESPPIPSDSLRDVRIGKPTEVGHCVAGTVYQRAYENGLVIVNISRTQPANVQVPPGFKNAQGAPEKSGSRVLGAHDSLILIKQ